MENRVRCVFEVRYNVKDNMPGEAILGWTSRAFQSLFAGVDNSATGGQVPDNPVVWSLYHARIMRV